MSHFYTLKKSSFKRQIGFCLLLLSLSLLTLKAQAQAPIITSFTPLSAKPGDVVTLTGTGFNTTSTNNIVFFGATKASVTAATATSLTVTVPSGATYAPITILNTDSQLAAYSFYKISTLFMLLLKQV